MAKRFLTSIDLNKNELRNAVIQVLASAPANPVEGQTYYDSSLKMERFWDGDGWVDKTGSDLDTEAVQDIVGAFITATGAATATYNDETGTLTINVPPAEATYDDEAARDAVAAALVAGNNIDITVNDAGDTITIDVEGLTIADVSGLQTALDGKADDAEITALDGRLDTAEGTLAGLGTASTSDVGDFDAAGSAAAAQAFAVQRANHTGEQAISTVTGLQTALDSKVDDTQVGAAGGVASLDGGGKVPSAQLPALALTDVNVVADIAARDALTVEEGDVAIVTGTDQTFIYDGTTWQEMTSPTDGVTAVTGGTGIDSTGGTTPEISIADGGVDTTQLADESVTAAKIAAAAVGTGLTGGAGTALAIDTTSVVRKYAVALTGGATSEVITHNLNTRDVTVGVYTASGAYEEVECDIEHTSVNTVTLRFTTAPTAGQYRVVVHG